MKRNPFMPRDFGEENDPWVIRLDFSDDKKWEEVCRQIAAPQTDGKEEFFAYVRFVSDPKLADVTTVEQLVRSLPDDYPSYLCFAVDAQSLCDEIFPVLVIDFGPRRYEDDEGGYAYEDDERDYFPRETPASRIAVFRVVPATIQAIENNLSITNMDFEDFANEADPDGILRGF